MTFVTASWVCGKLGLACGKVFGTRHPLQGNILELIIGATYDTLTINTSHAGVIKLSKVTVVDQIVDTEGVDTYILHTPVGQCPKDWIIDAVLHGD